MSSVKSRTAALVLAALMALIVAFAVSATPVMIDDAHAYPPVWEHPDDYGF